MKHLILSAIIALAAPALAHEDHNHEAAVEAAPHGGILRDAPPYKAELILMKDSVKLYVYDKSLKPVSKDKLKPTIKGKLAFPKDKVKRDVVFNYNGEFYEAKAPSIDKVHRYDLHITLEVEGKSILADFGVDNIN